MIDPGQPLAVMYHYVWPDERAPHGGVRPMRASAFEAQIDWLAERYDIVHPDAFLDRLEQSSDRPSCLLTFDDGTRDHAGVVTPILARRGLGGVFFIVSDAARGRLMPTTHLVHWLLGEDDARVLRHLTRFAAANGASLGDEADATRIYHYEPPTRARIKFAMNMALPPDVARAFAVAMLDEAGIDETAVAREWFAQIDDLKRMHASGMTLGVHGRTHESLQRLGPAIAGEIDDCSTFLATITGERPTWWACPFGGSGASAADHATMRNAITAAGIRAAVSTVSSSVPDRCDRLAIPRVDCVRIG